VREQFFLAATAQNIKRLVRFLTRPITPPLPQSIGNEKPKHLGGLSSKMPKPR
jgi:hypothetical protein